MVNTELVGLAAVKDSPVFDMSAPTPGLPTVNSDTIYTKVSAAPNGAFTDFVITRPLTPPAGKTDKFVVPLGQDISMIWAFGAFDAS